MSVTPPLPLSSLHSLRPLSPTKPPSVEQRHTPKLCAWQHPETQRECWASRLRKEKGVFIMDTHSYTISALRITTDIFPACLLWLHH
eukprot:566406-Rhodomonas_salina.1